MLVVNLVILRPYRGYWSYLQKKSVFLQPMVWLLTLLCMGGHSEQENQGAQYLN